MKSNAGVPVLDLTKPQPKYVAVFVLQSVFCENCKSLAAPTSIVWAADLSQIEAHGERVHADAVRVNKLLCTKPGLLINYGLGRLQGDLLK